jgi:hypothetical protein
VVRTEEGGPGGREAAREARSLTRWGFGRRTGCAGAGRGHTSGASPGMGWVAPRVPPGLRWRRALCEAAPHASRAPSASLRDRCATLDP